MTGTVVQFTPGTQKIASRSQQVASLNEKYAEASAPQILEAVLNEEFSGKLALVSSFGAESAVLLHLASKVDPSFPIIFLETGKHFAQTLSYRRKLASFLGLTNVIDVMPSKEELKNEDPSGDLWRTNTDACCTLRKVRPLSNILEPYDAWVTGRKQFHGGARIRLPAFEESKTHIKVNPLAQWSPEDIEAHIVKHDLPRHQLVEQGFPSIGCWPCTHPVTDGEDVRAGRWRGKAKTECGIHL